jgi:hypothetical protein
MPTVQVLDRAMPSPFRDTPRRRRNVLVGFFVGLGGGILLAFGLESLYRSLEKPELAGPMRGLLGSFGQELRSGRKRMTRSEV